MLTEWFATQNCDSVQIGVLFENIPGVSFFVKDLRSPLGCGEQRFFAKTGSIERGGVVRQERF